MNKDRTLSWFFRLQREVQAIVLASPHGYLPHGVAGTIPDHTVLAHRDETPQNPRRWLLRPAEANMLEDERLRLDEWWNDLPNSARSALLESRAGHVPHGYREAVLDLVPGGAPPDTDLNIAFELSGIAAAYIEMVAVRSRRGGLTSSPSRTTRFNRHLERPLVEARDAFTSTLNQPTRSQIA